MEELLKDIEYLDLLLLAMIIDIISGVLKAKKLNRLRSRTAWQGYAKKLLSLCMVVAANILDMILQTANAIVNLTVTFLIFVELISFFENCILMGMKMPPFITRYLEQTNHK